MLTEVHRQAADNPIVRLSMLVRAGERLHDRRPWRDARDLAQATSTPNW